MKILLLAVPGNNVFLSLEAHAYGIMVINIDLIRKAIAGYNLIIIKD